MVFAYQPTLRYHRLSALWALAMPAVASFYTAATIDSALRYWSGRGGQWKGRMQAARRAIDEAGGDTLLIGRAENFIVGVPDLDDAIARLRAYAQAGADCLYAPGIKTREQIAAVVAAVAPKPVNVLIGSTSEFTLDDLAAMGVRRVSVGGALARAAWGGFMRAARSLTEGRFDGFADAASGAQLDSLFSDDA